MPVPLAFRTYRKLYPSAALAGSAYCIQGRVKLLGGAAPRTVRWPRRTASSSTGISSSDAAPPSPRARRLFRPN